MTESIETYTRADGSRSVTTTVRDDDGQIVSVSTVIEPPSVGVTTAAATGD